MITGQTASMEDYLEAIAKLAEVETEVRVTEISKRLGVKKPSVTAALQKLSDDGLVEHRKYGRVELTGEGQRIAEDVIHRHEVLFRFLSEILGVDREVAQVDACKLEHWLGPSSIQRLTKFVEFILTCPRGEPVLLKGFDYYFEHDERDEELVARCLEEER